MLNPIDQKRRGEKKKKAKVSIPGLSSTLSDTYLTRLQVEPRRASVVVPSCSREQTRFSSLPFLHPPHS